MVEFLVQGLLYELLGSKDANPRGKGGGIRAV